MAAMVTWDNVRFSLLYQGTTDGNGYMHVLFAPAFPSVCHIVSCSLDGSGGTRSWLLGAGFLAADGFWAGIADQNNNPVVGAFLGVHYIAWGE